MEAYTDSDDLDRLLILLEVAYMTPSANLRMMSPLRLSLQAFGYAPEDYERYEERFGVPVALARFMDNLFVRLPDDVFAQWPREFVRAIEVGSDLSTVGDDFIAWLMEGRPEDHPAREWANHHLAGASDGLYQAAAVVEAGLIGTQKTECALLHRDKLLELINAA